MAKLTEEQRAELLLSNASRDTVEAVLARLDAMEEAAVVAMAPRAEGYEYEEACPFCSGDRDTVYGPDHSDRRTGYRHQDGCEWVALGTGTYEVAEVQGPRQEEPTERVRRGSPFSRHDVAQVLAAFEDQLGITPLTTAGPKKSAP